MATLAPLISIGTTLLGSVFAVAVLLAVVAFATDSGSGPPTTRRGSSTGDDVLCPRCHHRTRDTVRSAGKGCRPGDSISRPLP